MSVHILAMNQVRFTPTLQSDAAKSPGALSGTLQQEAQSAAQNAPHVGGLLGKLLSAVEGPRA